MTSWKGLILAGGTGSRLAPLTRVVNKHLLPVFDKPMIYYPLTTLMLADIRETIIVTTPESLDQFMALLGDGSQWGLKITYRLQERPGGIAEGFRVAHDDLRGHKVVLILGDNIFFGAGLAHTLETSMASNSGVLRSTVLAINPGGTFVFDEPAPDGTDPFDDAGGIAGRRGGDGDPQPAIRRPRRASSCCSLRSVEMRSARRDINRLRRMPTKARHAGAAVPYATTCSGFACGTATALRARRRCWRALSSG